MKMFLKCICYGKTKWFEFFLVLSVEIIQLNKPIFFLFLKIVIYDIRDIVIDYYAIMQSFVF